MRLLRALTMGAGVVLALAAGAGVAAAQGDPVFAPQDADELVETLKEAAEGQDICYGWQVSVSDPIAGSSESVGSNFGAGQRLRRSDDQCRNFVEFTANINYTSESSEAEDSASWSVDSSSGGPSTTDLDSLELISQEGLVGDNVDVDVAKAVAALPQLAADKGIAKAIEATPAAEGEAGDAKLTDDPGSDFWRQTGMVLVWGSLIVVAGIVFGIYAIRGSRRERYVSAEQWADDDRPEPRVVSLPGTPEIPAYVPPEWVAPDDTSSTSSTSDSESAADETEPAEDVEPADEPEPAESEPAGETEPADEVRPADQPAEDTEPPDAPPKT